ncbi:MAG: hypothetical protein LBE51_08710 [Acidovorax sp.]|jgi:hypothetical protein|nr:hypothetical protein [Acidovorax sp.]
MSTPKPFAKLFTHSQLGQLLVQRDANDDEQPGIRITFDPGMEDLAPCHLFLAVGGIDEDAASQAADQLFENFDEEMAVASVQKQIAQIQQMFSNQH